MLLYFQIKNIHIDGPDNSTYYWYDSTKKETALSPRQNGGSAIRVWGACFASGVSKLAVLEGRQNRYCYVR